MSAKCPPDKKFIPLIKHMQNTLSPEEFKAFINDSFENAEQLYTELVGNISYNDSPPPVIEVEEIKTSSTMTPEITVANDLYVGDTAWFNTMHRGFVRKITASSVFDVATKTFVKANEKTDKLTLLNERIFQYKLELLKTLAEYTGDTSYNTQVLNAEADPEVLTEVSNGIISNFANTVNSANFKEKPPVFKAAYNAYTILTKFDELLDKHIPFVKVKNEVKKSNKFHVDKYTYIGPEIDQITSWNDSNEFESANKHVSETAKILLDVIPEVNIDLDEVDNTSITLDGFNSIMTRVFSSLIYEPLMKDLRPELDRGVNIDMNKVISTYLELSRKNQQLEIENTTSLYNKLRGIQSYIYSSSMDAELRNIFTQMAYKITPMSYLEYIQTDGTTTAKNLKEARMNNERFSLRNMLQSRVHFLNQNPQLYKGLLARHKIEINPNSVTFDNNGERYSVEYWTKISQKNPNKNAFGFEIDSDMSPQILSNLVYDFLSDVISPDFEQYARQTHPQTSALWNPAELYMPLVTAVILNIENKGMFYDKDGLVKTLGYDEYTTKLANINVALHGADVVNVIKNSEGNNLPLYKLISLASNHNSMFNKISREFVNQTRGRNNILAQNVLFRNMQKNFLLPPQIRSDVVIGKSFKSPQDLTQSELLRLSIIHDFFQGITDLEEGVISLQPTTFSDKAMHFLSTFNVKQNLDYGYKKSINIQQEVVSFLEGSGNLNKLTDALIDIRRESITALVDNIVSDYTEVYNRDFKNLESINKFIANKRVDDIRADFIRANVPFTDELHAYRDQVNGVARVNETIENHHNTFNNKAEAQKRLEQKKREFAFALLTNPLSLNNSEDIIPTTYTRLNGWFDAVTENLILVKTKENGKEVTLDHISDLIINDNLKVELNPIAEAYFLVDNLLSNAYDELMTGGIYAHPNKNKSGDKLLFYEYGEAQRLNAKFKRNGIYGSTYHPLAQGLNNGVLRNVKIAVIKDVLGTTFNMMGQQKTDNEVMDGSGWSSPYYSRMVNNSLLDARAGKNKKTIFHDTDVYYGTQKQLKWAEYEISNMMRSQNPYSDVKAELMFKKMHNIPLETNVDFSTYYQRYKDKNGQSKIYYRDINDNKIYAINDITYDNQTNTTRRIIEEYSEEGIGLRNTLMDDFQINTLYDADQLFGGAFALTYSTEFGRFIPSESNIDVVFDAIVQEDLRDKMIGYLVNKSAVKVGSTNLNESSKFFNDYDALIKEGFSHEDALQLSELNTMDFSTEFGGLQLDSDHDLDFSEVSEVTQMISSLEEMGYTHAIVNNIYNDIANVVRESLVEFDSALASENNEELYKILAKSFVTAFMTGDRDTIGLAQSFVTLANQSLQKANLEYKIPFSAATINGIFVSTVVSNMVKAGIKRKYAGVASVIAPSNGIYQYYNIDGANYVFSELHSLAEQAGILPIMDENNRIIRSVVDQAINDVMFNSAIATTNMTNILNGIPHAIASPFNNPFIKPILKEDIDFEDTVIAYNPVAGTYTVEKIDSFSQYEKVKRGTPSTMYLNWTIKPKNLKQGNTFFTIGDKKFNIYDLDSVRLSFNLAKYGNSINYKDLDAVDRELLTSIYKTRRLEEQMQPNAILNKQGLLTILKKETQSILNKLASGEQIPTSIAFNMPGVMYVVPSNVQVAAAQIMMGRLQAKQLGLQPGDTVNQIKSNRNFFYDRMSGNYNLSTNNGDNMDLNTYDIVLFDGKGKKFYVKYVDSINEIMDFNFTDNPDFRIIDNESVWYNGTLVSDAGEKIFKKYTDGEGMTHDMIVITNMDRINELTKSKLFDTYKLNYTEANKQRLLQHQFNWNIENNVPVTLKRPYGNSFHEFTVNSFDGLSQVSAATLNQNEIYTFDDRLQDIATMKRDSFEKLLTYVGSRIPAQSMQSFMAMELVAFTEDTTNVVYVPKVQLWLQGSDFDIDKLYIMSYALSDSGRFHSFSNLIKTHNIDAVIKLPRPDGTKYIRNREGTNLVTAEDIQNTRYNNLDAVDRVLRSDSNTVQFGSGVTREESLEFMRVLNTHSSSKISDNIEDNALKNTIVDGIINVVKDPRNQINLFTPVNMDDPRLAAADSNLGRMGNRNSIDNPATKVMMQIENMLGKKVVGITAVALKSFFFLSNFYNNKIEEALQAFRNEDYTEFFYIMDKIAFKNPLNYDIAVLSNINFDDLWTEIQQIRGDSPLELTVPINFRGANNLGNYVTNQQLNVEGMVRKLRELADVTPASLTISAILSAATDNAKELILAKINATPGLVDLYNYLTSIGYSFDKIASIMTSTLMDRIAQMSNSNIFDNSTYSFNLKNAIAFYSENEVLPMVEKHFLVKFLDAAGISTSMANLNPTLRNTENVKTLQSYLARKVIESRTAKSYANEGTHEEQQPDDTYDDTYDSEQAQSTNPTKRITPNKHDYKAAYVLTKYIIERNNLLDVTPDSEKKDLQRIYDAVLPGIEEMQLVGKFTAFNKGINTNSFDKYNQFKSIETGVNRVIQQYNRRNKTNHPSFNLMTFLADESSRQTWIDLYEEMKTYANPLDAVNNVPHFREMIKMAYYVESVINAVSMKDRFTSKIINEVLQKPTQKLDKREYKAVDKYVNDVLIFNWIKQLNREIKIPVGQKYFTNKIGEILTNNPVDPSVPVDSNNPVNPENFTIPLNTIQDIASFKMLMDNFIIPNMKIHPDYKNNEFIKNLTTGVFSNQHGIHQFWKPPIDMMQIDRSFRNQTAYENMLAGFNNLDGKSIYGWNVVDLFYLYNLVTNKDGFGRSALTRFFEDIYKTSHSNLLIGDFYKYLANLDFSSDSELEYNINDLRYRITFASNNSYNKFESYLSSKRDAASLVMRDPKTKSVITTVVENAVGPNAEFFTFTMPFLFKQVAKRVIGDVKPIVNEETPFFNIPINQNSLMKDVMNNIRELYGDNISEVYNDEFNEETDPAIRNANAYIEEGRAYINMDKLDIASPVHEFTHMLLAGLKERNPDIYYHLLSLVRDHELYSELLNNLAYANKRGSDIDEEVFATIMGEYFKNRMYNWSGNVELKGIESELLDVVKEIFGLTEDINVDIQSLMATSLDDVMQVFGSVLFSNNIGDLMDIEFVKLNQKMATLKDNLMSQEIIKTNCK